MLSPSTSQIGWKPDPSQPKPSKRGSGQISLKDALGDGGESNKPL